MRAKIKALYRDYFNNFLTETAFADYYSMDDAVASRILAIGRKLEYRK